MALTKEDLSALSEMMDMKLQPINTRLDNVDARLDKVDARLDNVESRLDTIEFKQDHMAEKLKGIEATMNYNDFHLQQDIKNLHEDVTTIAEILKINGMLPIAK